MLDSAPDFQLTRDERACLAAFLRSPDVSEAPVQDFARITHRLRCAACHELNGPAKLQLEGNPSPPPLTDAGNKLRQSWLEQVLHQRKRVRPWLTLRMPQFDRAEVGALPQLFAAQAGAELGEGAKISPPPLARIQQGVALIGRGEGGLSCITCHDFRGEKSTGDIRGPDLVEIYDRARVDWLARWLREPIHVVAGTGMPAFFTGMPIAEREEKISRILAALSAGKSMPAPEGLSEDSRAYLLQVRDEPVVFRGFITECSPRAIAVGLPGMMSYCFDAEACAVRQLRRAAPGNREG